MITVDCIFEPDGNGKFKCKNCGLVVPRQTIKANCRKAAENIELIPVQTNYVPTVDAPEPPSLVRKVVNFMVAAARHTVAGSPVVKEETMKTRLEICKSCPLFKPNENAIGGVCTHNSCGCGIQDNLQYFNKIAWADQECPIGKWGKEGV